ncbi:hypothetical protein A3I56_03110 [Candidatus Roizmanbacteria bacterium RIFCSPLOWO2_02_FULL_43_10]|uniref:Uncharacterized protein n=1 Tax=Candidatus Roizmanbacteria bacterium RIFCSPLOWO2_02_FULL_43_10 TaxID=1802078 RepID=A0A1F7K248_9BACT|nr:MAG: hypothetical protein A3I56_03110 [Candidatus Roizmanbacteria bacterium RIFCSPLOWO2_02_FULL_43_10]
MSHSPEDKNIRIPSVVAFPQIPDVEITAKELAIKLIKSARALGQAVQAFLDPSKGDYHS